MEINEIAVREDETKLSKVLLLSLAGLCAGLKPCKIAEKVGWKSSSLRGELCNKLYKYIKILVGKEGEKANWKTISQWLHHWLEQVQREINSFRLTLADISEIPSVTAEQFINPAQKEILKPMKIGFLPSDIANLDKEIDNADNFYTERQYEQALEKYQSVIAKVFAHYPNECGFMEALVKVVSCYNKIQAYRDLEELGSFALAYVKDEKGKADLYDYIAGAWHKLYLRSNNSEHLKNTCSFYREAYERDQHDCMILWNIFDLYVEAYNRENQRIDYLTSMKLAWKVFLYNKQEL